MLDYNICRPCKEFFSREYLSNNHSVSKVQKDYIVEIIRQQNPNKWICPKCKDCGLLTTDSEIPDECIYRLEQTVSTEKKC